MRPASVQSSSSPHSPLTIGHIAGHRTLGISCEWPPSGSILCPSLRQGRQFLSTSLNLSKPWAVSFRVRNERLPSLGFRDLERIPRLHIRTKVSRVVMEGNVQEELHHQGTNSSDEQQDDFAAVLGILKVEDKFRYHKVPKLKALKLKLDPAMVLRILKHREVQPSNKWKFFVWVKKQMGFKHTTETYNMIIVILLEIRKFTSIFYLMEDMYKDGVFLTPETCVKMAKMFGRAGMVERAIRALNHISTLGYPVDTRHLNSVVMELLKSQHHYKAYIAYREMAKTGCPPDGLTFKLILRELGRVEKVELACNIFDDMQTRGCEPDVETASIVTGMLCRCGRIDDAIELFEKVKQKGIKLNAKVYSYLLNGLAETGNVEKALDILEEMRSQGYTSERDSITALVDILKDSGREEDAQKCLSWAQDGRGVGNWR